MRITLLFPTLILADFHIDNLRNTVVNGLGGQTSWTFVAGYVLMASDSLRIRFVLLLYTKS